MSSRKYSIALLINLIIVFISLIVSYLVFSQVNAIQGSDTIRIEERLNELDGNVNDMKVVVNEWKDLLGDDGESDSVEKGEKPDNDTATNNDDDYDIDFGEIIGSSNDEDNDVTNDEPEPDPEPEKPKKITYTSKASDLNVRSSATTSSSVVTKVGKGSKLEGTGNEKTAGGYDWVEVTTSGGKKGWVAKQFLD